MTTARLRLRYVIVALATISFLPALSRAQNQWWLSPSVPGPVVDVVVQSTTRYVVAASQGTNPGGYRSTNRGKTYTKVKAFTQPYRLAQVGGLVFAATSQGLYQSSNLTSWTLVTGGLPSGASVTYVGVALNSYQMYPTVATGTSPGFYRTTNSGATGSLVLPTGGTQAMTQGWGCGFGENATGCSGALISC